MPSSLFPSPSFFESLLLQSLLSYVSRPLHVKEIRSFFYFGLLAPSPQLQLQLQPCLRMRYDDWDVLLFPSGRNERVPLKEFKVNCHVVPDTDFSHSRATFGVPVMTCFVPGLQPAAPFHISVHSWGRPRPSQYTQNYSNHPDLATFEARIFIDGRMVA